METLLPGEAAQPRALRRAAHAGRLEELGLRQRSAVCKDSLLFLVVPCRAASGDPNPLDENKVDAETASSDHLLLFFKLLVYLLSVDSKLLEGRLAPSRSSGPGTVT